ncbi:MAG TPA: integrase arm-type DNA-binding domain-containing protein [Allosphingosinicella sp.]|jgi:integrase
MLTNATVKAARPSARAYKLGDAGGLYLYVRPSGSKTWRMKFRYQRREKLLTFGDFPDVALVDARELRDRAREQLRRGEDPTARSAELASIEATFEAAARRWHAHQLARWSTVHAADVLTSLERDVFPAIGALHLGAIDAPAVLRVLRDVERRGAVETARRLRQRISGVFGFAMSEGIAAADPAAIVARALAPSPATRRHPALLELADARALLAAAERVDAAAIVKLASRFLALTAVRLAALRGARWDEFQDLDGAAPLWRIPAARMKLTQVKKADPAADHLVPLSAAAVDVLRQARAIAGDAGFVFPGRGGRLPIGEAAIGELYIRAGHSGRHVPHGWRATFSTIMNERSPGDRDLIDRALAHAPKDKVEAAYNRAEHLERRRDLFQRWADLVTA